MTKEQYERAIQINNRIHQLENVKEEIKPMSETRLTFSKDSSSGYRLCNDYIMRYIGTILDKHDKMIREEIDQEIEKLEKEIEGL